MAQDINQPKHTRQCEKCDQGEGILYTFHFGNKLSETNHWKEGEIVTKYHVSGEQAIAACDGCIKFYRLKNAGLSLLIGSISAAGFYWAYYWQDTQISSTVFQIVLLIVTGLGCLAALLMLLDSLFSRKNSQGENLAISLKKTELKKQGFDSFWNSAEFSKLQL